MAFRYGDYSSLGESIERYIKVGDQIEQIGCGNSTFASEVGVLLLPLLEMSSAL